VGDTGATLPIRASAFPTPVRPTLLYIYIGGKFWVIRIVLKYKGKGERGEKTRETSRGGGARGYKFGFQSEAWAKTTYKNDPKSESRC
jgi:hypothetical protein